MLIVASFFFLKNFNRIYIDYENKFLLHQIKKDKFQKINKKNFELYFHENSCGYSKLLCSHYYKSLKNIDVVKKNSYLVISNK